MSRYTMVLPEDHAEINRVIDLGAAIAPFQVNAARNMLYKEIGDRVIDGKFPHRDERLFLLQCHRYAGPLTEEQTAEYNDLCLQVAAAYGNLEEGEDDA